MRLNRELMGAFGVSAGIHATLFIAACFVGVGMHLPSGEPVRKFVDVKIVEKEKPVRRSVISRAGDRGAAVSAVRSANEPSSLPPAGPGDIPKKSEDVEALAGDKAGGVLEAPDKGALGYTRPPSDAPPRKRAVRDDVVTDRKAVFLNKPDFPASGIDENIVPNEFVKEMPGFTPSAAAFGSGKSAGTGIGYRMGGSSGGGKYRGLEEFLTAYVSTYHDTADGQRYFRITFMAGRDAEKLPVLPKEMTFLVDCSLSMQPERIEEFKKGLIQCLHALGANDTFDLISFREGVRSLSAKPLTASPEVIDQAARFVDQLAAGNSTDVYRALASIIKAPPGRKPSYIMLLSDGKPSIGITDSREIITKINHLNRGNRPIFCYSGGVRVNRYLLDFLSYRNRGWSEYAERTAMISKGLPAFYAKIKDPILLNLRYRFANLPAQEIYPKMLPDFYKGTAFTIYGRYKDEDEFSMQLLGDTKDDAMEFIFSDYLSKAEKGTREIAREWAFNKVYYLIGKLAEKKDDPTTIREIQDICKKFAIKTPYSEGIK